MKSLLLLARLSLCAMVFTIASVHGNTFAYTYTFGGGTVVSGAFDGTQSGNLISDISNATLRVNGTPVGGTVFVYGFSASGYPWTETGATVSFDGTQNSFLFTNGEIVNETSASTAWFLSVPSLPDPTRYSEVVLRDPVYFNAYLWNWDIPLNSSWSVTQVPDVSTTLALLGGTFLALAALRRRFAA